MKVNKIFLIPFFIFTVCSLEANNFKDIIHVQEILDNISFGFDPVKNAVKLSKKGILDPRYSLNHKEDSVLKNGNTIIGVCIKRIEDSKLDNSLLPPEMKKIQVITQDFYEDNKKYSYKAFDISSENIKKVNDGLKTIDVYIYTSRTNSFRINSKNGEPFRCNSLGEMIPKSEWKSEWKGLIKQENYITSKDVIAHNNHFVYTVDKFHKTLNNYIETHLHKMNPMNFIYYPVLTENIIPVNIHDNTYDTTYNPFDLAINHAHKYKNYSLDNNDTNISTEQREIDNVGKSQKDENGVYINNRSRMIDFYMNHDGEHKFDMNATDSTDEIHYKAMRAFETDDIADALLQYSQIIGDSTMISQAVERNIDSSVFIFPYCYWANQNTESVLNDMFTITTDEEFPTEIIKWKENPYRFTNAYFGNEYQNDTTKSGDISNLKIALNATRGHSSINPEEDGFIPCVISKIYDFNKGGDIPSNFITAYANALDTERNAINGASRLDSGGNWMIKEGTEIYKWLQVYRKAYNNELDEEEFKTKSEMLESKLNSMDEDILYGDSEPIKIYSQFTLATKIKEYLTQYYENSVKNNTDALRVAFENAKNSLGVNGSEESRLIMEMENNLLTIKEVLEANQELVENGFPRATKSSTGNEILDDLFNAKINAFKEKKFGKNETNKILKMKHKDFQNDYKFISNEMPKEELLYSRIGSALAFSEGRFYKKMSTHSFGGAMTCTNFSPCPLNQIAFRDDGTPGITVIGKSAYGSLMKKGIVSKRNSTEDSIFVMNSYIKNDRVVPFVGEFEIYKDNTGNMVKETKFFLVYFYVHEKEFYEDGIKKDKKIATYTIKPYGINLKLNKNKVTSDGYDTSENALALAKYFDIDFKKSYPNLFKFSFINTKNGILLMESNPFLQEEEIEKFNEKYNIQDTSYALYGINRVFNNIIPTNFSDKELYVSLRYNPNIGEEDRDIKESRFYLLGEGESLTHNMLVDMPDSNVEVSFQGNKSVDDIYRMFKFNDYGYITTSTGEEFRATDMDDPYKAEKLNVGVNAYQVGGFDIYAARKDDSVYRFPTALYRGRFMLNPTPENNETEFTSTYWRDGDTKGIPYKLYRQPTFDMELGITDLTCPVKKDDTYIHIEEMMFDPMAGKCPEGTDRKGFVCEKRTVEKVIIGTGLGECKSYYKKDILLDQNMSCQFGEYNDNVKACATQSSETEKKTCLNGAINGKYLGKPGECLMPINEDNDLFDSFICNNNPNNIEYSRLAKLDPEDFTEPILNGGSSDCYGHPNYKFINAEYDGVKIIGCYKPRKKGLGVGCRTWDGKTLDTGEMLRFIEHQGEGVDTTAISANCWGGAIIVEEHQRDARFRCPAIGSVDGYTNPTSNYHMFKNHHALRPYGVMTFEGAYTEIPSLSTEISCPGTISDKFSNATLCGDDGEFDTVTGACKIKTEAGYSCENGSGLKVVELENRKINEDTGVTETVKYNKMVCAKYTCEDGEILSGNRCVKCVE